VARAPARRRSYRDTDGPFARANRSTGGDSATDHSRCGDDCDAASTANGGAHSALGRGRGGTHARSNFESDTSGTPAHGHACTPSADHTAAVSDKGRNPRGPDAGRPWETLTSFRRRQRAWSRRRAQLATRSARRA
jgi:hypothetical protein